MSTRATYTIEGISFYIHHDGYAEGAATYFAQALVSEHDRPAHSNLAGDFCRANSRAEILVNGALPERHSDREYHYEVAFDTEANEYAITAFYIGFGDAQPEIIFSGSLLDFINQHNQMIGDSLIKFDNKHLLVSKIRETADALKEQLVSSGENTSRWSKEQTLNKLMQLAKYL